MSYIPPGQPLNRYGLLASLRAARFLHITINYKGINPLDPPDARVKQTIDTHAIDWMRYSGDCWIIWTKETPEAWYKRLVEISGLKQSSILIFQADLAPTSRSGQLPQWAWDWLSKLR